MILLSHTLQVKETKISFSMNSVTIPFDTYKLVLKIERITDMYK